MVMYSSKIAKMKAKLVKTAVFFLIVGLLSSCAQQRCVGGACSVKTKAHSQQAEPPTPGAMIAIGGGVILGGGLLYIYLANTLGAVQQ